jgi:chemotaxis protein histidine kinase CheA
VLIGSILALPTITPKPTWKQRLEAKRAQMKEEINEEIEALRQQMADKKTAYEAEKQKVAETIDQFYKEAEEQFQQKLDKINEWKEKNPVPFALEVEGEPSLFETIRAKYEGAKNAKKEELNTEIDKIFPGYKQAVDEYEAQEAAKREAKRQEFDEFKENARLKMNETKQKFDEFAKEANAKLKADWETKKEENKAKMEKAHEVLSNVSVIVKNATHNLLNKIKEEKKVEAQAKLQAAQWISDKMKNKTEEWKQKHPLLAARSFSDVSNFLNDASGASGWQTATTVLMIICFIITIGLLIIIFKQIRSRQLYEKLDGNTIHSSSPHSMVQPGYNPNFGNPSSTFVPSGEALRKQEYPQLF